MPRVLAISSHVACGHVGLAAIVPALQALGHDVIALPTVLLSNHPGHAHVAGARVDPDQLRRMLGALEANGWLAGIDAVLTGYLPSVEHVRFAADAVAAVTQANPRAIVLVDPILGDDPKGLYIDVTAAAAIRDTLLPAATTIKLNAFELSWLTGIPAGSEDEAARAAGSLLTAARRLNPVAKSSVLATSVPGPAAVLSNVFVAAPGARAVACRVERLDRIPKGTGDLLSALLLAAMLSGVGDGGQHMAKAVAGLDLVVRASGSRDELCLVPNLARLGGCRPLPLNDIA